MFIKLHFADTLDPLYVNVYKIIAFHRDQGDSGYTLLYMEIGDGEDGYYLVEESPETISGLIGLVS